MKNTRHTIGFCRRGVMAFLLPQARAVSALPCRFLLIVNNRVARNALLLTTANDIRLLERALLNVGAQVETKANLTQRHPEAAFRHFFDQVCRQPETPLLMRDTAKAMGAQGQVAVAVFRPTSLCRSTVLGRQ